MGRPTPLERWTSYPRILSNRCLSLGLGWFSNFEGSHGWGLWLLDEGRAGAWYLRKGGTGAWQGPSFLLRLFKECMGRWPGWQSGSCLLLAVFPWTGQLRSYFYNFKVKCCPPSDVYHIKRKWSGRTLSPYDNPWLQTSSEVMAKSTTRVCWSKGAHVWLDGTWFERNDRPGWLTFTAFYAPPVAAVLWCQFLCAKSIKWSPVSGVSLRFSASLSDGSCSAFSEILWAFVHGHSLRCLSEKVLVASYPKLCQ